MNKQTNIEKLTEAGIIPKGYDKLSKAEQGVINGMTKTEVDAIISATSKVGKGFVKKHAPHGMSY